MASDKVMVDTSAFYALTSNSDEFYSKAKLQYQLLVDGAAEIYTSSYIFTEAAALIHRRLGYAILENFVGSVRDTIRIVWATRRTHWQAWELLKQREGRGLSFVDCTTCVLAKSLDADVFGFDQGFLSEGLRLIPR